MGIMKYFLFSVFSILVGLSVPSVAMADGLLTFEYCGIPEGGSCQYVLNNSVVSWEIGVCSPVNPAFENQGSRTVTAISGFEFRLLTDPGLTVVGVSFPAPAINVGGLTNLVVGFGTPVPVEGPYTALATVDFIIDGFADEDLAPNPPIYPCYFHVAPAAATFRAAPTLRPAVPGRIAIVDADDTDDPLVVLDNGEGLIPFPEFTFRVLENTVVLTDGRSWGHIKSLYR